MKSITVKTFYFRKTYVQYRMIVERMFSDLYLNFSAYLSIIILIILILNLLLIQKEITWYFYPRKRHLQSYMIYDQTCNWWFTIRNNLWNMKHQLSEFLRVYIVMLKLEIGKKIGFCNSMWYMINLVIGLLWKCKIRNVVWLMKC